ncbi:MAG: hypothetical protein AAFW87_01900 [Pseudomonadota bacterium]
MTGFDAAAEAMKDVKDTVADKAQEKAVQAGEQARDAVTHEGDQFADAAYAAASEFEDNDQINALLSHAGQAIEGLTAQLKEKQVTQIVDDVAVFAKRNLLLFLGGAALAGFAAARFLKAKPPQSRIEYTDPWSGHLSADTEASEGK